MSTAASSPAELPALARDGIRSPWRMAARRFWRNRLAVAGLLVLILLLGACFGSLGWTLGTSNVGPALPRYAAQQLDLAKHPPTVGHWMGTDALGRDLGARFLLGGALSLSLGIASALVAIIIGTLVGLLAGYLGGRTDALLMRLVDVLYGLPYLLLVILMRVALVPLVEGRLGAMFPAGHEAAVRQWSNVLVLLAGIGSVSWLTLARVVRGQVLSLREQPFVEAARALGFSWRRIIARHILPNLVGTIVVYGTLTVPAAILSESFLSFLGLGIQPPLPSWGNLASEGMSALNPVQVQWWMITWPCLGLSLALLALNFVGDGIRDAVDPRG